MGLVGFLNARLDEDERVARQGLIGHHPVNDEPDELPSDYWSADALQARDDAASDWDSSWHTHQCGWRVGEGLDDECQCGVPARVLAEVAAKRAVLNLLPLDLLPPDWQDGPIFAGQDDDFYWGVLNAVYALLQPYKDHPDFDPAWKPS